MSKRQLRTLVRILVGAAFFVLAVLLPVQEYVPAAYAFYAKLALFLVPYLIIGYDVLLKAARNIGHGQVFDENFLMCIATIGAFCIDQYPEAVAVMFFYQVGELFQAYAVGRSRRSIAALMDIRPDIANLERGGEVVQVDPETVQVGDVIVVKPGERVPLDGTVLAGASALDTSALTGESLPREVAAGSEVVSGCINLSGLLRIRVAKEFGQSTVSKILELVENASEKKARSENFITKFARYYTPAVVVAAVLLAVVPPLFTGAWSEWVRRALIFLVISCPCALVISVPLSFFGGIGGASRCGILVKGAAYLESLARTKTVVFDKTGTLTKGTFRVTALHPGSISEQQLLEYAALAESYSKHPISQSLLAAYGRQPDPARVSEVEEIAGHGVAATVDGRRIYAGNGKLMARVGASYRDCHLPGTIVHVAVDGMYEGHIVISDEMKEDAKEAVAGLKAAGVTKTLMLTGDRRAVGEHVAAELGLDGVYAELLPADKVEKVEQLLHEEPAGSVLAFVGDGINDAPVLSRADVGIAMGGLGSDAAIEAADVVLMDDKPSKIALAVRIARRTLRIARQNVVFALAVKGIMLLMGAFGVANLWEAVFADVGVSVIAILNAMRALSIRPYRK